MHIDGGLLPEDRVLWTEAIGREKSYSLCDDSTGSQRYCIKHLLADWAILLAGYDGKVTSDSSQAGEDLKEEQETTTLSWAQTHI